MSNYKEELNRALTCINENIDALTERYVNTSDPEDSFTNAIRPLLYQQSEILKFLKELNDFEVLEARRNTMVAV